MLTLWLVGEVVPITFEDAVREYLGSLMLIRQSTSNSYAYELAVFGREIVWGVIVDDLTGQHIDQFIIGRLAAQNAESTISGYVNGTLSAFFNWCIKRNYAARNPLKQATRLPARKHRRQTPQMSFDLIERIVDNLDTDDRKVAVAFAAMRPMDRGTLSRLHSGGSNRERYEQGGVFVVTGCTFFS